MWASATGYTGLIVAFAGLCFLVKPVRRLRVGTRARAIAVTTAGVVLIGLGVFFPTSESRVSRVETRLDEFTPVWHFNEVHAIRIAAAPARVFEAIRRVRADEIRLFHTLTWIRRGGRDAPPSILNAGGGEALIDVATRSGFVRLADEAPRELLIGAVVMAPPGSRGKPTSEMFRTPPAQGFALATMNFLVKADGSGGSLVSTETRVFASGAAARRRFAVYWRVIYPGSAIIRRMWLRAIERRALGPDGLDPSIGGT